MSWSENREKGTDPSLDSLKEKVKQINAVLTKLARDEDLHDDLKMPDVQRALQHWTGEKRLPPEQAEHLRDHRRAIYVLQRLQMLQMVCNAAGVKVPLELMLNGSAELPPSSIKSLFPKLWEAEYSNQIKNDAPVLPPSTKSKAVAQPKASSTATVTSNNKLAAEAGSSSPKPIVAENVTATSSPSTSKIETKNSEKPDNSLVIVLISLVVSLLATFVAMKFMS